MKKVWAILIWGVLVFGIGTYLDKVREMLMLGGDLSLIYILRFGIGFGLGVLVVLVGRWMKRWLGKKGLGPGDWFMIGAVAWALQGGYGWWVEPRHTMDIFIHDTVFVVAQWHLTVGLVLLYSLIGLIYYLAPMNKVLGFIHFFVTHAALYLLLWMKNFDQAYLIKGYLEYHEYQNYKMVSGGYLVMAVLVVVAQLLFVINLFLSLFSLARRRRT